MSLPPFSSSTPQATFSRPGKVRQHVYNIKDYGAKVDGTTDDHAAVTAAFVAANAAGGGRVYSPPGTVALGSPIVPLSNVVLCGDEAASIWIRIGGGGFAIQGQTTSFNDFVVENIKFLGNNTTAGITTAIEITGNLDPDSVGAGTVTNFIMRNVIIQDCTELPVRIFGVTGKIMVTGCDFNHSKDAGFGWNQEVIFMGNHSLNSKDNGFSLSRGNTKVICVGNTVDSPTFWGIWLSGFNGEQGPSELVCDGNVVLNSPKSGISLIGYPTKGSISGNYVDQNHNRPVDIDIDGIEIFGNSSSNQAYALTVSGNTIMNAARAGISLNQTTNIFVTGNLIINPGTQFLADGVTAILASDTTTNAGILTTSLGSYTNVWINNNTVIDDRATPYCNWDYWKVGTAGVNYGLNFSTSNLRNATQLQSTITKASNQLPIFTTLGGMVYKRTTVSDAAYSILSSDYIVAYITLTGPHTATLPTAVGATGQVFIVTDETGSAGTNNITVATVSAQTINGASTFVINKNYGYVMLYSNGANWRTAGYLTNSQVDLTTAQTITGTKTFSKIGVTTGSNASAGTGTLASGTVTISTTAVTANSLIFLTDTASSLTNVGTLSVSAKSAGTSFTVTSANALDTSTFNWLIIN